MADLDQLFEFVVRFRDESVDDDNYRQPSLGAFHCRATDAQEAWEQCLAHYPFAQRYSIVRTTRPTARIA